MLARAGVPVRSQAAAGLFTPDGRFLAHGRAVWDVAAGRQVRQLSSLNTWIVAVSPDGQWLAYEESQGGVSQVTVERLENGAVARQIVLDGSPYLTAGEHRHTRYSGQAAAFTADSQNVVVFYERWPYNPATETTGHEYWAVQYPVAGGPPATTPGQLAFPPLLPIWPRYYYYDHPQTDFRLSPDGGRFYSFTLDNVLRVWDFQTGQRLAEGEPFYLSGQMALDPDNETFAVLTTLGVDVIACDTGERVRSLHGYAEPYGNLGLAFTPAGHLLVERADALELWDAARDTLIRRIALADQYSGLREASLNLVALSPDGRWFAHRAKYVTVYDLATGQPRHTFGSANIAHFYAFTPDGRYLALTSGQAVGLWNTDTGQRDRNLAGHGAPTGALAFTPDGARLVSASGDIWDVTSGERIAGFDWGAGVLTVSPDGALAVGGDGQVVALDTGEFVGRVAGLRGRVVALAFTPDGRRLLAQYDDGVVDVFGVNP